MAVSDSTAGCSAFGSKGSGTLTLQSRDERIDASVTPAAIARTTIASSIRGFCSPIAIESSRIHSGTVLLTMV